MIDRKQHICAFCGHPIAAELIAAKSVARNCSSWVIIRTGVHRQHLAKTLGAKYAHNACAEAALRPGRASVGQQELWPNV